jgi:hypothetical protein
VYTRPAITSTGSERDWFLLVLFCGVLLLARGVSIQNVLDDCQMTKPARSAGTGGRV